MKHLFTFTLLVLALTSCQINVMDPFDGETIVPDATARIARRLSVGGTDGKTVYNEDRYEYNQNGLLTKLSRYGQNGSGSMALYFYTDYKYDSQNVLTTAENYSRVSDGSFQKQWVSQFEHPTANREIETSYYIDSNTKALFPQNRTETIWEQGQKVKTITYYMGPQTFEKSRETLYRYQAGRLVAEENLSPTGTGTVLRYDYKGRKATVGEFMTNRAESISEQKLQYDSRGRLVRQEVTKVNPIYCIAMVPNSATIYEYAD